MGISDWKLKLLYGKLKTPFSHFTVLADGKVIKEMDGFDCPKGPAWMGIKVWAIDCGMAIDMARVIGENIGFKVKQSHDSILVYDTAPEEPPRDNPYGYDIKFTPYTEEE